MFATTVFIFILLLPAAFLPLWLNSFSSAELKEMGVCLETSDDTFPMQGYELDGVLPTSNHCDAWDLSKPLQSCQ
jgi:hypothetical protein